VPDPNHVLYFYAIHMKDTGEFITKPLIIVGTTSEQSYRLGQIPLATLLKRRLHMGIRITDDK